MCGSSAYCIRLEQTAGAFSESKLRAHAAGGSAAVEGGATEGDAAPAGDTQPEGGNSYELAGGTCLSVTTDGGEGVHFGSVREALGGQPAGVRFLSLHKARPPARLVRSFRCRTGSREMQVIRWHLPACRRTAGTCRACSPGGSLERPARSAG